MDYKSVLLECEARSEMYRCSNAVWNRTHEENCIAAITSLLARAEVAEARAEKAERERDAAIKELGDVSSAVDDLADFIDEQVHPIVSYDIYTALRENADSISMWKYEAEWHGKKEE